MVAAGRDHWTAAILGPRTTVYGLKLTFAVSVQPRWFSKVSSMVSFLLCNGQYRKTQPKGIVRLSLNSFLNFISLHQQNSSLD